MGGRRGGTCQPLWEPKKGFELKNKIKNWLKGGKRGGGDREPGGGVFLHKTKVLGNADIKKNLFTMQRGGG